MPETSVDALSSNYQKTHYVVSRKKQRVEGDGALASIWPFPPKTAGAGSLFRRLENGKEPIEALKQREQLYRDTWSNTAEKISEILHTSNTELFENLSNFAQQPFKPAAYRPDSCIRPPHKLKCGFIAMSSDAGNNFRVLAAFYEYLKDRDKGVILARQNSKENNSVRQLFRDLLAQIREEKIGAAEPYKSSELEETPISDDEADDDNRYDKEGDDDDEDGDESDGRTVYDLQRLRDWYMQHPKRDTLKVVIVFEDVDSFTNQTLNQFLKMIYPFADTIPMKLVFAASSSNVSNWLNTHINNEHRIILQVFKFQTLDNKQLAYKILAEIFLDRQCRMVAGPQLISIILHRFETSNNSIDALLNEIKIIIMTYFYAEPLSVFASDKPEKFISRPKIEALRHLGSFKKHIERLLRVENKNTEIKQLIASDDYFIDRFKQELVGFHHYICQFNDFVKALFLLQGPQKVYEEIELYNLWVNRKLVGSKFFDEITSEVNLARQSSAVKASFKELLPMSALVGGLGQDKSFATAVKHYLTEMTQLPVVGEKLFFEVFTYNGGGNYENPAPFLLDNYECLMLDLLKAPMRQRLEQGLSSSERYLSFANSKSNQEPIMVRACNVMNEAPPTFNTYEYFMAFKQTVNKEEAIEELITNVKRQHPTNVKLIDILETCKDDEKQWEKVVYSWFLQCCSELLMIGFIKEKPRGDHFERAIWKGL